MVSCDRKVKRRPRGLPLELKRRHISLIATDLESEAWWRLASSVKKADLFFPFSELVHELGLCRLRKIAIDDNAVSRVEEGSGLAVAENKIRMFAIEGLAHSKRTEHLTGTLLKF